MDLHIPSHESAHIIPHKHPIAQPNFLEFPKEIENRADSYTSIENISSKVQRAAFDLFDIGLNPFPLPLGKKGGYPWKQLQYTRLDRDDEQYGLYPLFSGQCNLAIMCGRTSRNLFVIDCETNAALQYHIDQLRSRQIALWVAKTARGGHIYLLSRDGEVENVPSGTLNDAEIRGRNNYVLAPPSLHPNGDEYSWLSQESKTPPTVSIDQIDWLVDLHGMQISLSAHQSKSISTIKHTSKVYSFLSKRTRNYIHNGHNIPQGSRNNELFAASCDMAGNNFSQEQTLTTLSNPATSSGLSSNEIQKTVASAYSSKRTPSNPYANKLQLTPDWKWALIFGDHHNWSGRSATIHRAVFTALIHRAKVSNNEDGLFRASIREIASLARVGTATVQRTLKIFLEKPNSLVIKCGKDKTSNATLWKFSPYIIFKAQQLNPDTLKESPQWLSCSVSPLSQPDAIERQALGYNGLLIYRVMREFGESLLPKQLVEMTSLAVHQVKYALKKLSKFDLIDRLTDGWVAQVYSDEELDLKIHQKQSIIGKGQERVLRFKKERGIYAGRQLFYARLRTERNAFKRSIYDALRMIRYAKFGREKFLPSPIYKRLNVTVGSYERYSYQRVSPEDLDDTDRAWIECALALGAEVFIEES